MYETDLLGSLTPGLEGAPRSQTHGNRRGRLPNEAVPAFRAESAKEGKADATEGIDSAQ